MLGKSQVGAGGGRGAMGGRRERGVKGGRGVPHTIDFGGPVYVVHFLVSVVMNA